MHRTADRRLLRASAAGLILLLGFTVAGCGSGAHLIGRPWQGGPVEFSGAEVVQAAGFGEAEDGMELIFGANFVQNLGDAEAALQAADLIDSDGDITAAEVVDARVLPQDLVGVKAESWGAGDLSKRGPRQSWEVADPIEDYILAPGETVVLFLKVIVHDADQLSRWRKTNLSYSSEGRDYVTESNFGFFVCGVTSCEDK